MEKCVRGAHAGYAINGIPHCESHTSCPRINFLRQNNVNVPVDETSEMTFALGLANEQLVKKLLISNGIPFEMDVEIKYELREGVNFVGHEDFVLYPEGMDGRKIPKELKSISSTKMAEKVLINNEYKTDNLCQLLSYMIGLNADMGHLHYVNYVWHTQKAVKNSWSVKPAHKVFIVTVDECGDVFVDGNKADFSILNVKEHLDICAEMVKTGNLAMPKPVNPKEPFNDFASPCNFCKFVVACDKINSKLINSSEEFVNLCSIIAEGGKNGNSISV